MTSSVQDKPAAPFDPGKPLIVDMDGALLRTDVLAEGLVAALFRNPLGLLIALSTLVSGRAKFKRTVAAVSRIDVATLPRRLDFIEYIAGQRKLGRAIHLVSAGDHETCEKVASAIGLFDSVRGSVGNVNLKGRTKARAIAETFPDGFVYAGDSAADLEVWRYADATVLAGASPSVAARARRLGKPIEAAFAEPAGRARAWLKALRLHQWSKNVLLFAPLFLSGLFVHPEAIAKTLIAFFLLGATASGTYILNDLSDLPADRLHRTKHTRPFASGALPIGFGLLAAPILIFAGLVGSFALSAPFGWALVIYTVTTVSYSLRLKRVVMLDVMLLAGLYTLRVIMGAAVLDLPPSSWLLTFAMGFFFSLSLAKRHVEIERTPASVDITGRGYRREDGPVTLAFGVAAAVGSIVILVQYLMEEAFPSGVYRASHYLWAMPILLAMWTMRIWLLAHRGELDDDPVAFAVKDKISLAIGAGVGAAFLMAAFR